MGRKTTGEVTRQSTAPATIEQHPLPSLLTALCAEPCPWGACPAAGAAWLVHTLPACPELRSHTPGTAQTLRRSSARPATALPCAFPDSR